MHRNHLSISLLITLLLAILLNSEAKSSDLIGWYQFNDSSNLGLDSSGFNNNGTVLNNGAPPTYDPNGLNAGSVMFNGGGSIQLPINTRPVDLPNMTWGAWVKPNVLTPNRTIISNDDQDYDRTLSIDNRGGNNYSAFTNSSSPVFNSGVAPTNSWIFIAGVYENNYYSTGSGLLTFYVGNQTFNGIQTSFGPTTWLTTSLGSNPSFAEYWDGQMDDAFVFNGALDPTQMQTLIANGPGAFVVPEPSTLLLTSLPATGILLVTYLRRKKA